jgi:hypothetical protein
LAGRPPEDLVWEFAQDTFSLTTDALATKYNIAERTARDWRLYCKRELGLQVGYGANETDEPRIEGVTADTVDDLVDPQELWDRAFRAQDKAVEIAALRADQHITLPNRVVGLAQLSDMHFGNPETDYRTAYRDAEIIRDTPYLYAGYSGDGFDNWIINKLAHLGRTQVLPHDDELRLFLDYLAMLEGKLLWSISGNHDGWTRALAGIDVVRAALKGCLCLYDTDEVVFDLRVGPSNWTIKARHKWRYNSIYNATHGQEVGWQRGDVDFDIALGGHTHIGTLCRPFFRHEQERLAILTGTYKRTDKFAREIGVAKSHGVGSGALILYPDGRHLFIKDLHTAAEFLTWLNST